MHKLLSALVLLAAGTPFGEGSTAVALPFANGVFGVGNLVVLAGGMDGGGGGMGGAGGGMGGMTGGGMGGMTGGGMGGMTGGMSGFGGTGVFGGRPANGMGLYGGTDANSGGAEPAQYFLCVTPYDRCSLASSPGSLRSGSACTCSTGHRGTIK